MSTHPSVTRDSWRASLRQRSGNPAASRLLLAAGAVTVSVLAGALAIGAVRPPVVVSTPDANAFSSARAMDTVRTLAAGPRIPGSGAHRAARESLRVALASYGLDVQTQQSEASRRRDDQVMAVNVHNVIGRLNGRESTGAVLLTAHYDTTELSPGAADAGAGVAAILDAVRVLRGGPPLRNDIIVLFSDAEEYGLLGASTFLKHPWSRDVAVVFNFEARGHAGPLLMFETSERNGWLVREYARAAVAPFASSLLGDVYRRLGANSTDLSVYRAAGLRGLNFAFIDGPERYHSHRDTADALDRATLQHVGSNTLALARHFGQVDFRAATQEPDAIFFDAFGLTLIWYSKTIAWIVFAALGLAVLAILLHGFSRAGRLTGISIAGGLLTAIVTFAAAPLAATGVWLAVGSAIGRLPSPASSAGRAMTAGLIMSALAVTLVIWRFVAKRAGDTNMSAAALLGLWIACGVCLVYAPGASYLLLWPLFASVLAHLAASRPRTAILTTLGTATALALFAPLSILFLTYFGFGMPVPIALGVFAAMTTWCSAPAFAALGPIHRAAPVALSVAAVVSLIAAAGLARRDSPPVRDSLAYAVDTDTQQARWISRDRAPDPWTRQFLGDRPKRARAEAFTAGHPSSVLLAEVATTPVAAVRFDVVSDRVQDGERRLGVRATSARPAHEIFVRFISPVTRLALAGETYTFSPARNRPAIRLIAFADGAQMDIVAPPGTVELWLSDRSAGLPAIAGFAPRARPATIEPAESDATWSVRRCAF